MAMQAEDEKHMGPPFRTAQVSLHPSSQRKGKMRSIWVLLSGLLKYLSTLHRNARGKREAYGSSFQDSSSISPPFMATQGADEKHMGPPFRTAQVSFHPSWQRKGQMRNIWVLLSGLLKYLSTLHGNARGRREAYGSSFQDCSSISLPFMATQGEDEKHMGPPFRTTQVSFHPSSQRKGKMRSIWVLLSGLVKYLSTLHGKARGRQEAYGSCFQDYSSISPPFMAMQGEGEKHLGPPFRTTQASLHLSFVRALCLQFQQWLFLFWLCLEHSCGNCSSDLY